MKEIKINTEHDNNMNCEQGKVHLGMNIQRIREMLQIKQLTLAEKLNISQQAVSNLENRDSIEDKTLDKVAKALKVPVLLIKNFNQDDITYGIQNNYYNGSKGYFESEDHTQITNTNTIEMIKYALQENKKLYDQIIKDKEQEIRKLKQENEDLWQKIKPS